MLLERLKQESVCTSANLYDLTKAFDMLSSHSVLTNLHTDSFLRPTLRALLADMQGRLQIQLPIVGQAPLRVSLGAGVLQRDGTGPRLFRLVYDDAVHNWQSNTLSEPSLTTVVYEGIAIDQISRLLRMLMIWCAWKLPLL